MLQDKGNSQFQIETLRDRPDYFHIEKYISSGYYAHFHRNVEILCIFSGSARVMIDEEEFALSAGDAVFVRSFQIHSYKCENGTEVGFALIGSSYMRTFYKLFPDLFPPVVLNDKEKNKALFDYISAFAIRKTDFTPLERYAYADILLHLIVSAYGVSSHPKPVDKKGYFVLPQVIQYIYENYDQPLTLSSIAEHFNYAPSSLSRLFSQYIKIDIRNFINGVRIQNVLALKDLPKNEKKSIIELAFECGFNSSSSFYRAYSKAFPSADSSPSEVLHSYE